MTHKINIFAGKTIDPEIPTNAEVAFVKYVSDLAIYQIWKDGIATSDAAISCKGGVYISKDLFSTPVGKQILGN